MLTHLRSRMVQISVAALGIVWGAGASADPGPSGNYSSARSGPHHGSGPAPLYAPSPMPLASPYSGNPGPGRSYAPGSGGSGTANSGPSYILGPSGAPALPVSSSTASSVPASTPSLGTSVGANPTGGPGAPPVVTEAMPNPRTSTSPADRITLNVPAIAALGAPEGQTLPAFRAPLPPQATVTTPNGGVAFEPAAQGLAASVRSEEPCDGLRLIPGCRPLGAVPFLPLGVLQPRSGSLPSGQDERVAEELTDWPWRAIGRVNVADSVSRRFCTGTLVGPQLVLTAGQCLFDYRLGRWVKPEHVHFVVGQVRDRFLGHSRAEKLIVPPELRIAEGAPPQRRSHAETSHGARLGAYPVARRTSGQAAAGEKGIGTGFDTRGGRRLRIGTCGIRRTPALHVVRPPWLFCGSCWGGAGVDAEPMPSARRQFGFANIAVARRTGVRHWPEQWRNIRVERRHRLCCARWPGRFCCILWRCSNKRARGQCK